MIHKTGAPNKIRTIASSEKEFENIKDKIVKENNLARCARCGKLLAKLDADMLSVKRKDVDIIAKIADVKIKCPVCHTPNGIVKGE
jgi:phage FluMu protein Com